MSELKFYVLCCFLEKLNQWQKFYTATGSDGTHLLIWMRALTILHLGYVPLRRLFKNTSAPSSLDLVDFFREALGGLGFVSNYDDDDGDVGADFCVIINIPSSSLSWDHGLVSNHDDHDGNDWGQRLLPGTTLTNVTASQSSLKPNILSSWNTASRMD